MYLPSTPLVRVMAAALALVAAPPAGAQDVGLEALPGTQAERYLRALQVSGQAPLHPWSVRDFSPREMDALLPADSAHPWAARTRAGDAGVRPVRPRVDLSWSSGFPDGHNDGAVWAGRGVTARASAGAAARWGALSLRVEPVVFWTQNADFDLMAHGGPDPFADPVSPRAVDLPQRFGDGSYARVDPGETWVRLDVRGLAAGAGTGSQHWGPAIDQPLLLGPNAPGFVHAFAGTSRPLKVGIGRVHGRMVWGRLEQSAYSPAPDSTADRFMAGVTAVFLPWGLDGLEVGVARFFHIPWRDGPGVGDALRPLETFLKVGLPGVEGNVEGGENQLASVFARLVLPRAGVELYGEYARDDHNYNAVDLLLEPDHASAYLLGGSRAWRRGGSLLSLRAEWVNAQASHLQRVRNQGRLYRNTTLRQGHTHRGQLLGSPAGLGGGGSVVALEAFTPRGGWSVDWSRTRMRDNWGTQPADEENEDAVTDVVHSLGAQALFFRGGVDVLGALRGSWELNRHLGDDAFNVTASLGVRVGL